LFYAQGYFRQRLDDKVGSAKSICNRRERASDGTCIGKHGEPVTIQIDTRGSSIRAKVWRVKVGRIDLLLLDSNVDGNAPEDRELTSRLYGGDGRVRIRQELLLGVAACAR